MLVHFVDEKFEGRQEWVPPARLKVRWEAIDAFRASEARWDRIFDLGRGFDDAADGAATEVFTALIAGDIARMEYREAGACRITDSGRLTEVGQEGAARCSRRRGGLSGAMPTEQRTVEQLPLGRLRFSLARLRLHATQQGTRCRRGLRLVPHD